MAESPDSPPSPDPRVALAAERTLLAWMRTGLAMMGFGFVVARFGLFLRELAAVQPDRPVGGFSRWMGVALVLLGVVVNAFAAGQHLLVVADRSVTDRRRRISGMVAIGLSGALAVVGVAMAVYLVTTR